MKRSALLMMTLLTLAIGSLGCLDKVQEETIYLEPDGKVTWTVLEREVRSDEDDVAEREEEEKRYLDAALAGRTVAAEALSDLGGRQIEVTVLRERRPFSVQTEATFSSIVDPFRQLIAQCGMHGVAQLKRHPDGRQEFLFAIEDDSDADCGDDSSLEGLFYGEVRWLLAEGRFLEAEGFEIEEEGRRARQLFEDDRSRWTLIWK